MYTEETPAHGGDREMHLMDKVFSPACADASPVGRAANHNGHFPDPKWRLGQRPRTGQDY